MSGFWREFDKAVNFRDPEAPLALYFGAQYKFQYFDPNCLRTWMSTPQTLCAALRMSAGQHFTTSRSVYSQRSEPRRNILVPRTRRAPGHFSCGSVILSCCHKMGNDTRHGTDTVIRVLRISWKTFCFCQNFHRPISTTYILYSGATQTGTGCRWPIAWNVRRHGSTFSITAEAAIMAFVFFVEHEGLPTLIL